MKKLFFLLPLILVHMTSLMGQCDDFGLRINSALPNSNTQLLAFPPSEAGVDGKQVQLIYDHDLTQNFYLESAFGYASPTDIFEYSGPSFELGPGVKEQWGPLVMKLMVGGSYMPNNSFNSATWQGYNSVNFVIHLTFGLKDPKTGVFLGLDRCHYSDGFATNNPAQNYSGFVLTMRI